MIIFALFFSWWIVTTGVIVLAQVTSVFRRILTAYGDKSIEVIRKMLKISINWYGWYDIYQSFHSYFYDLFLHPRIMICFLLRANISWDLNRSEVVYLAKQCWACVSTSIYHARTKSYTKFANIFITLEMLLSFYASIINSFVFVCVKKNIFIYNQLSHWHFLSPVISMLVL